MDLSADISPRPAREGAMEFRFEEIHCRLSAIHFRKPEIHFRFRPLFLCRILRGGTESPCAQERCLRETRVGRQMESGNWQTRDREPTSCSSQSRAFSCSCAVMADYASLSVISFPMAARCLSPLPCCAYARRRIWQGNCSPRTLKVMGGASCVTSEHRRPCPAWSKRSRRALRKAVLFIPRPRPGKSSWLPSIIWKPLPIESFWASFARLPAR